MKALFILLDGRVGGPQTRIIRTAPDLCHENVITTLMVPSSNNSLERLAGEYNVDLVIGSVLPLTGVRGIGAIITFISKLLFYTWRLQREIRVINPDVVVIHGSYFLQAAISSFLAGKKMVWFLNDTSIPNSFSRFTSLAIRAFSSEVIAQGKRVRDYYRLPVDGTQLLYTPSTIPVNEHKRIPPVKALRVGILANWSPVKDLELFVRTIYELHNTSSLSVWANITGKKLDSQKTYVRKVENIIETLGLKDVIKENDFVFDTCEFYRSIDIFLLTSKSEASPGVVAEAMSQGVPVVSTDVGAVKEMLSDSQLGIAGEVIADADPKKLASSILQICGDSDKYIGYSKCGKLICNKKLNPKEYASSFAKVVRSI